MRFKTSTSALSWSHDPSTRSNAMPQNKQYHRFTFLSCAALSIINRAVCESNISHLSAILPAANPSPHDASAGPPFASTLCFRFCPPWTWKSMASPFPETGASARTCASAHSEDICLLSSSARSEFNPLPFLCPTAKRAKCPRYSRLCAALPTCDPGRAAACTMPLEINSNDFGGFWN